MKERKSYWIFSPLNILQTHFLAHFQDKMIIWSYFFPDIHSLITNLQTLSLVWLVNLDQEKCKKCDKSLLRLEEIDDDADQKGIGFVKILDPNLAFEYGLEELPALVYYRHKIPIVYDGMNAFPETIFLLMH